MNCNFNLKKSHWRTVWGRVGDPKNNRFLGKNEYPIKNPQNLDQGKSADKKSADFYGILYLSSARKINKQTQMSSLIRKTGGKKGGKDKNVLEGNLRHGLQGLGRSVDLSSLSGSRLGDDEVRAIMGLEPRQVSLSDSSDAISSLREQAIAEFTSDDRVREKVISKLPMELHHVLGVLDRERRYCALTPEHEAWGNVGRDGTTFNWINSDLHVILGDSFLTSVYLDNPLLRQDLDNIVAMNRLTIDHETHARRLGLARHEYERHYRIHGDDVIQILSKKRIVEVDRCQETIPQDDM
jgi:hypothetical protein